MPSHAERTECTSFRDHLRSRIVLVPAEPVVESLSLPASASVHVCICVCERVCVQGE